MKQTKLIYARNWYQIVMATLLALSYPIMVNAQFTNTPEGRLALLCKTWGMVKYHHSEVKIGNVNWDSVLVSHVLNVKNAATVVDFNNEMNSLVDAAGTMMLTLSPSVPNMPVNVDFSWINDPMLDATLQGKLQFIKDNFVADNNYYVSYASSLLFPHDDATTPNDTFPIPEYRFLYMFKFWNIINYYFPYKHDMDILWDQSLLDLIPAFDTATSALSYHIAFAHLNARLNDSHAGKISSSILNTYLNFGSLTVPVNLRKLNNQFVVFRLFDTVPGLHEGDIIHKVNGMDLDSMLTEFKKYYSLSNDAYGNFSCLRRLLQINGNSSLQFDIEFEAEDSTGAINTVPVNATMDYLSMGDSLYACSWCGPSYQITSCGYGYVNMGKLMANEVTPMYNALQSAPAIIFDLRNYPQGTAWSIATKLFNANSNFSRLHIPITIFPGDYDIYWDNIGSNTNPTPYLGKIYILVNEVTISQAEYSTMMLSQSPCASAVKIIGSTTAGADGDVCSFHFPGDLGFSFSGLGVFYPDSTVTQRIGIVPDTVVIPTPAGIRHHVDEVLMAALDCITGIETHQNTGSAFLVYPNPSDGIFNIQGANFTGEDVKVTVVDVTGNKIFEREFKQNETSFNESIDLGKASDGIYLLQVTAGNKTYNRKIILN